MKKIFAIVSTLLVVLALAACGTSEKESSSEKSQTNQASEENKPLVVGASNVPHAEILEQVQPILADKGIDLVIETYQDYILPNEDLDSGDLDANYFQHIPYLESQMADVGYDFVNAGGVHIEPIGVYSQKYSSLDELPEGAVIIMSNSVADHGRILTMLESQGLIKLADDVEKVAATLDDIVENPKNLEFEAEIDAALLPEFYNNDEGDAILINTNYAIDAGLNPLDDAIAIEGSDSPYVNIIAVRSGDEKNKEIVELVNALRSEEIQNYIIEEFEGAVVPVSE
ncbi:MetQ/NlpA family ABC transporter substrate-binding protein [Bacillus sp. SM2101]|uniref:MetQ/NlpA family ABC transporter substrate-binding protein n=1 Tax=Bacillus sp. SM2101 TaxID=2805366 RepID=UPI001BDED242|nr:MetQ/NlpA family ABC transporter substrate-binding protein [Bacillus sp. SM2101]